MIRFVFLLIFIWGCSESQQPAKPTKVVFEDSKLVFVVDDDLWKKSIDSLVHKTFEIDIEGLSSSEPMFLVVHTNKKKPKGYVKKK